MMSENAGINLGSPKTLTLRSTLGGFPPQCRPLNNLKNFGEGNLENLKGMSTNLNWKPQLELQQSSLSSVAEINSKGECEMNE